MKIIHTADLHMGSRFKGMLGEEKGEERRRELRSSFSRLVEYARINGIDKILIAGDLFDSTFPLKKDKDLFCNTVKRHPEISFYYLRGNHDHEGGFSDEGLTNLFTFSDAWTQYSLGENVVLSGIEATQENVMSKYGTLFLNADNVNIVTLHGAISGARYDAERIDLKKLEGKNIDYLALGHFHSYTQGAIDARGSYAYSGCLEGRGFDECGEKGFCVYDTDTMSDKFVPFAQRTLHEIHTDISGSEDAFEIYDRINAQIRLPKSDIVRVVLKGEVGYELGNVEKELSELLKDSYYYVNIVDKTRRSADISEFENELSLRGEFIRAVNEREDLTSEQKLRICLAGMKALKGDKDLL